MTSTFRPIEKRTDPNAITVVERRLAAVQMRLKGFSYRQIGEALGVSPQAASGLVRRELDRHIKITSEEVERMRQLDAARLDAMLLAFWDRAMDGELKAAQIILKVLDQREKLFGLNDPAKLESIDVIAERPYEAITDDERAERLAAILDEAKRRKQEQEEILSVQAEVSDALFPNDGI